MHVVFTNNPESRWNHLDVKDPLRKESLSLGKLLKNDLEGLGTYLLEVEVTVKILDYVPVESDEPETPDDHPSLQPNAADLDYLFGESNNHQHDLERTH
ncbi:hypothetical protein K9N68_37435 (plasmid) [Kovacikia minuta CCNUW1]|uniref:hypothetical protein n=1 Tax=Kovacikia minuta TaxID=2931930 RepID=UPI001CCFCB6F|nr:hypothetical protein [Kovacikia minuta]UBF29897.1 hypothetical protein K9N68_37435 [Kovacikia minuta CCNUW1]